MTRLAAITRFMVAAIVLALLGLVGAGSASAAPAPAQASGFDTTRIAATCAYDRDVRASPIAVIPEVVRARLTTVALTWSRAAKTYAAAPALRFCAYDNHQLLWSAGTKTASASAKPYTAAAGSTSPWKASSLLLRATVAAEAPAGSAVVRYDPEWASRQLLGQNTPGSTGYAVTLGGRTVSAYAAERVAQGGPGRPPTSLEMVDDILNSGTSVRFDPLRDTIRVRAPEWPGKPYVVVDSTGQHVVTVMVPK
jgi:hypothetical protein